ncbi:MAG: hypothetical protein GF364_09995 [Candidatus Lokiarchaeota archaeon]|nr:hypothetical protein [Candidatus Lokiarchaeota archaeon]
MKTIQKNAKIYLDTIENDDVRGGLQPFSIVILLPEQFPQERLAIFEDILQKMSAVVSNKQKIDLKKYYEEIVDLYLEQAFEEDLDLEIEDGYSITAAVNDFNHGLELYKNNKYNSAYRPLKKAMIKFEEEDQKNLIAEASFLLGTILLKTGKYENAAEQYRKLVNVATEINKAQYIEKGMFMAGFSYYKVQNYVEALEFLNQLNVESLKYISPLKYLLITSKVYENLKMHKKAIEKYEQALRIISNMPDNDNIRKQRAQIYYALGIQNFRIAISSLRALGIKHTDTVDEFLIRSINFLKKSVQVFKSMDDYESLIPTYRMIAEIYGFKNEHDNQFLYLSNAKNAAERSNNITAQLKVVDLIIKILKDSRKYEEIIPLIDNMFEKFSANAFVDMFSIARLHQNKGEAYLQKNSPQEALDEFLITLNIYKKIDSPLIKRKSILEKIIEIYEKRGEKDHIEYYNKLLKQIKEEMDNQKIELEHSELLFGPVKEVWIMAENGPEMYNYAPETEVDTDLLGGFMTAMQAFSMELQHESLNSLVIGRDRYDIVNEEDKKFFILGRSSIKTPDDVSKRILRKVSQLFYETYKTHLDNYNGDVTPFRNFTEIINKKDFTFA